MRTRLKEFFYLWNRYSGRKADKDVDRDERLAFCAQCLGQVVESLNHLSEDALETCVAELRRVAKTAKPRVVSMTGRPEPGMATPKAVWKIDVQLRQLLRWEPAKLSGFLKKRYGVATAKELNPDQAWRVIEGMVRVAAREAIKLQFGKDYEVPEEQLRDRVAVLKKKLTTWRPEAA